MIKRTIKHFTPNYKTLDTPIEQARAIQDLYDQVRIFYDYLNNPNFDISHTGKPGPPGPPGDKGDKGMSSFEVWKTIPGNEDKTIEDYFNEIKFDPSAFHGSSKVVELTTDITFSETTEDNTQINIIYLNNSDSDKNIIKNIINYEMFGLKNTKFSPFGSRELAKIIPSNPISINCPAKYCVKK